MTVLVDEIGAMAAENIQTIVSQTGDDAWSPLQKAGWTAIAADPDAGLDVRALQEVARTTGRYTSPLPLVPTLLAGRWFGTPDSETSRGVSLLLAGRDGDALVPYASGVETVLDASGHQIDVPLDDLDDFARPMPVARMAGGASHGALSGERAAELHAALAAAAVGCADAVCDRAVDWVQTRQQFGQPIKAFQAVRHHLANEHIAREQAWTAAIAAAQEPERAATWSSMACDLATTSIELGIQVHGGVGFTWEVGLHHFLNHVLQVRTVLGSLA